MTTPRNPFLLNVGFIVAEGIGFTRDFEFGYPQVHLPPDLDLFDLTGTVRVTRTPQGLPVQVKMRAFSHSECARCLRPTRSPLEIDFTEMYAFSKRSITDSGLLMPETGRIDLQELVREYMLLEVPIRPLCRPDCKGLCPVCGENLNVRDHTHTEEPEDPRLTVLKKLLDEDETQTD